MEEVELEVEREYLSVQEGIIAILLKDKKSGREVPIMVTPPGSISIEAHLVGFTFSQPYVYDLLKEVITGLGATVVKVKLTDFDEEGAWQVELCLSRDGDFAFKCKFGDAIAIALVCGVPIVIDEKLFSRALEDPRVKDGVRFVKEWLAASNPEEAFMKVLEHAILKHPEEFEDSVDRSKLN